MFKTIVVAVDGSDHARNAIDIGSDLAQKYDARLLILSVYRRVSGVQSTQTQAEGLQGLSQPSSVLRGIAQHAVDEAVARAQERGASAEGSIKPGQPARSIVEFAKEQGADAIILGSRGLGDIGGFLLGSVSHKVSGLAECTVITVK